MGCSGNCGRSAVFCSKEHERPGPVCLLDWCARDGWRNAELAAQRWHRHYRCPGRLGGVPDLQGLEASQQEAQGHGRQEQRWSSHPPALPPPGWQHPLAPERRRNATESVGFKPTHGLGRFQFLVKLNYANAVGFRRKYQVFDYCLYRYK